MQILEVPEVPFLVLYKPILDTGITNKMSKLFPILVQQQDVLQLMMVRKLQKLIHYNISSVTADGLFVIC